MLTPDSLQACLRAAAAATHRVVERPPFVLCFDRRSRSRFFNYAIPTGPVAAVESAALAGLRAEFARRRRRLRFEFIEEAAPRLGPALAAAGLVEQERHPLMVCTPAAFRPAAAVAGLVVAELTAAAPIADLAAWLTTRDRGFAERAAPEATEARAGDLRGKLQQGLRAFLGTLDGQPAAVGALTPVLDGFTELAGITTLPACRRRGIATALTAAMTAAALAAGATVAFLSAEDEAAGRIYARVGFRPYASALVYGEGRGPRQASPLT